MSVLVPVADLIRIETQIYTKTCSLRTNCRKLSLFYKIFAKKFGGKEKLSTFAIPNEKKTFENRNSRIAQLVRASDC